MGTGRRLRSGRVASSATRVRVPRPSAQSLDLTKGVLTGLLAGLELKLQAAVSNPFFKPRVTLGALAFCGSFLSAPFERAHARDGLSAPRNRPVNAPSVPTFFRS